MRRLSLALVFLFITAVACSSDTIDHFSFNYTLSGRDYTTTFDLVDGQQPQDAYGNVVLNGDPTTLGTITLKPSEFTFDPYTKRIGIYRGLFLQIDGYLSSNAFSYGSAETQRFAGYTATSFTFNPGTIVFSQAGIVVDSAFLLPFDRANLVITQTSTDSSAPSAVTPEPSALILFGTGLAGVTTA